MSFDLEVRSVQQEKQLLLIVLQRAVLKLLRQLVFLFGAVGERTLKVRRCSET